MSLRIKVKVNWISLLKYIPLSIVDRPPFQYSINIEFVTYMPHI